MSRLPLWRRQHERLHRNHVVSHSHLYFQKKDTVTDQDLACCPQTGLVMCQAHAQQANRNAKG